MPDSARTRARRLLPAVGRGLRGRCPACGRGRLFTGYIAPAPACSVCGEDLTPYRTADLAPYLVVFANGLVFVPLSLVLAGSGVSGAAWLVPLLAAAGLGCAALLLPRAKGAALALLWAMDG